MKMDLQGYTRNQTGFSISPTPTFPGGLIGNVPGTLFRYLLGPQFEPCAQGTQPFIHRWFGGTHTNVYGNAFRTLYQPVVGNCGVSKVPTPEVLALDFGGGVDIPISRTVPFRAAHIDEVLMRSNPFIKANNQKNFRCSAEISSHSRMVGTSSSPQDR